MIVDCISDLHGERPELEGGDLLIVAGDLTITNTLHQHTDALEWLCKLPYRKKIVVGGNHDGFLQDNPNFYSKTAIDYLCDSGTEFEGFEIWGSPWTRYFDGMNPHCMAFTKNSEEDLAERWEIIPSDTDILVTHTPPYTIRDGFFGSNSLLKRLVDLRLKLHVFGHIHEGYGKTDLRWFKMKNGMNGSLYVNASYMDENYEPVNAPVRVIL